MEVGKNIRNVVKMRKNEKLIQARKDAGYKSQNELCRMLNIKQNALSCYESFIRYPTLETAQQISGLLENNVEDLFEGFTEYIRKKYKDFYLFEEVKLDEVPDKAVYPTVRDDIDKELLKETFKNILKNFTKQEKAVIISRFFNGKTLDQTGKKLKKSKERIRQIETQVLRKFRYPKYLKILKEFR